MASYNTNTAASQYGSEERDAEFRKFDQYPWVRDRSFMKGLIAMLAPLTNSFEHHKAMGITLQARIWWYQSRLGTCIDLNAYKAYAASNPSQASVDTAVLVRAAEIQAAMGIIGPSASGSPERKAPEWQTMAAQKVDLSKKADDGDHESRGGSQAPYPARFNAIIDAINTGKPIEGIVDIPDKIVRKPGIGPVGKMKAPRKPWEGVLRTNPSPLTEPVLDAEFPPIEQVEQAQASRKKRESH